MRTIALGDIHGEKIWKEILDQEKFDRVIFLADYFDTLKPIFPLEQLENFYEICKFKKESDKEVILLVGNHDYHYMTGINEEYSGYQPLMRQSFQYALDENKDLLQMCFVDENDIVYSHAGITETWLNDVGINVPDIRVLVDSVNELVKYKPYKFAFYPDDRSNTGDNVHQSPIWVRPESLYRDGISQLQVVGHTARKRIEPLKSPRQGFYVIDTLGTSREYLVIEDGIIKIVKHEKIQVA